MKVSLCVQTFSASVADSIRFARERLDTQISRTPSKLKNSSVFNRLFDVLNISSPSGRGWKAPITLERLSATKQFLQYASTYIKSLCNSDRIPLKNTQRNIGFIGLLINIQTVNELIDSKLSTGEWRFLLTYKFSQDHLELLFNCVRRTCKLMIIIQSFLINPVN